MRQLNEQVTYLYLAGLFLFLRLVVGTRRSLISEIGHGSAVVFMLGNLPVDMNWVTGAGFVLTFGHAETDILVEFGIKAHGVAP